MMLTPSCIPPLIMERHPQDGRVVSNFIIQALKGEQMTIYGDGTQTRSFCYVQDLVDGLIRLMNVEGNVENPFDYSTRGPAALKSPASSPSQIDVYNPVNLGNPTEFTMLELANQVAEAVAQLQLEGLLQSSIAQRKLSATPFESIRFMSLPIDDPKQRRPDIKRARALLGWGESA